jgi:hypothetical protein
VAPRIVKAVLPRFGCLFRVWIHMEIRHKHGYKTMSRDKLGYDRIHYHVMDIHGYSWIYKDING